MPGTVKHPAVAFGHTVIVQVEPAGKIVVLDGIETENAPELLSAPVKLLAEHRLPPDQVYCWHCPAKVIEYVPPAQAKPSESVIVAETVVDCANVRGVISSNSHNQFFISSLTEFLPIL